MVVVNVSSYEFCPSLIAVLNRFLKINCILNAQGFETWIEHFERFFFFEKKNFKPLQFPTSKFYILMNNKHTGETKSFEQDLWLKSFVDCCGVTWY